MLFIISHNLNANDAKPSVESRNIFTLPLFRLDLCPSNSGRFFKSNNLLFNCADFGHVTLSEFSESRDNARFEDLARDLGLQNLIPAVGLDNHAR